MSGGAEFSLSGGNEKQGTSTMAPNEKKQQEFDSVVQLERNEEVATVGVLAIQGAFAEHVASLRRAAAELEGEGRKTTRILEVRNASDFDELDGLVIPGGESTTLNVFFEQQDGLYERLVSWAKTESGGRRRRSIFGTCAGLIFLSDRVDQQKRGGQLKLGGLDVTACRNFFGRQRQSFQQDITVSPSSPPSLYPGVFIRAPGVANCGPKARVLATVEHLGQEEACAVEQQKEEGLYLLATSFHPELTEDLRFHRFFLEKVLQEEKGKDVVL